MKLAGTIIFSISIFMLFGCTRKTEYERIVEKELAKGVRNDSLFLGYELGMSRNRFYEYSRELNKKKMVKEGPRNMTVEYELKDKLPHPATMNFYPDFNNDKIYRMRTTFAYKGWAPWNKNLGADSLIFDVKKMMKNWYGKGFIKCKDPKAGLTFKKVDGNREIVISKAPDDIGVNVNFTDLTVARDGS